MHRHYFRPPRHLVKEWPEVFEDLYMDTMPVAYVDVMILEFNDGRVWKLDVGSEIKEGLNPDLAAKKLLNTLQEYKDTIKKIDFKIDIEKLKQDIKNRTDRIF